MTASAEPILRCLQNSTTLKILVPSLNRELHHGINHMLELVGTGHLARLVDLANHDRIAEVLLAVIGDQGQGTLS